MFRKGQLIVPRGKYNNQDLFEVICVEEKYIQAMGIKLKEFVRFPKTSSRSYRAASDKDIESYFARHLKYHLIQDMSEGGKFKLTKSYIETI